MCRVDLSDSLCDQFTRAEFVKVTNSGYAVGHYSVPLKAFYCLVAFTSTHDPDVCQMEPPQWLDDSPVSRRSSQLEPDALS